MSKRDYKHELAVEKKNHPERVHQRAMRNAARKELIREGKVNKGDKTRQVDHIKPISKGGTNDRKNLRVESTHKNESYPRNSDRSIKLII